MRKYRTCLLAAGVLAVLGSAMTLLAQQPGERNIVRTRLPQKYALLVGVNDYQEFRNLSYCVADVQRFHEKLVEAGFPDEHVTVLSDKAKRPQYVPTKNNIEKQLELLLATLSEEDLVVVAFSGHGVHFDGTSYLCPIDAQFDRTASNMVAQTLVPLKKVYDLLESCPARQKLLLVDACRNDPDPGGTRSTSTKSLTDFAGSLRDPPKGILVLTACTAGQVSVEDPSFGHGVFMYYLMQGLEGKADRDRDGKVTLLELYQFSEVKTKTHVRVARNLVQTPELSGRISGDYEIALVPKRISSPLSGVRPETAVTTPTPTVTPTVTPTPGARTERPTEAGVGTPATTARVDNSAGVRAATGQADEFYRRGQFDQALNAYDTVIAFAPGNKELYLKRGAAYLAKGNIEKAVIDYQLAGKPVALTVTQKQASLRAGEEISGTVKQGQTLYVTRVKKFADNDWLWVASVNDNSASQGWVLKKAVLKQPEAPKASTRSATADRGYSGTTNSGGYTRSGHMRSGHREYDHREHGGMGTGGMGSGRMGIGRMGIPFGGGRIGPSFSPRGGMHRH